MEDRYCNSGDKCCPVRDGCNICTKTVNTLKGILYHAFILIINFINNIDINKYTYTNILIYIL